MMIELRVGEKGKFLRGSWCLMSRIPKQARPSVGRRAVLSQPALQYLTNQKIG